MSRSGGQSTTISAEPSAAGGSIRLIPPSPRRDPVPHTFRHSHASHLAAAGVPQAEGVQGFSRYAVRFGPPTFKKSSATESSLHSSLHPRQQRTAPRRHPGPRAKGQFQESRPQEGGFLDSEFGNGVSQGPSSPNNPVREDSVPRSSGPSKPPLTLVLCLCRPSRSDHRKKRTDFACQIPEAPQKNRPVEIL